MKVFKAIIKTTGEVVHIVDPKSKWWEKIKLLRKFSKKNNLLCERCEQPVRVQFLDYGIYCFICNSRNCNDYSDPNSPIHDEFAKGEEDYYNPEHFEADDD